MSRTFTRFEEIEPYLRQSAPPTVYKYRSWKEENHKNLLNKKELWFSHPFELEDTLDVRPDAVFNVLELQDPRFFDKLMRSAKVMNPNLTNDTELRQAAETQWLYLNLNPETVLENWNNYNLVKENFDQYGIFSTSTCPDSERLWAKYGDNHEGYALGFDTVELCRIVKSSYDDVEYSDDSFLYTFLENEEEMDLKRLYLKKTSWEFEHEYRYITVGIGMYCDRSQYFERAAVRELILGCNSNESEEEIIRSFNSHFDGLPIYKMIRKEGHLSKTRIG